MRQGTRLIVMLMALLALGMALPACGGGSTGGQTGGKDLYLKKFMLVDDHYQNIGGSGTTNAFRDTRIMFVFNFGMSFSLVSYSPRSACRDCRGGFPCLRLRGGRSQHFVN